MLPTGQASSPPPPARSAASGSCAFSSHGCPAPSTAPCCGTCPHRGIFTCWASRGITGQTAPMGFACHGRTYSAMCAMRLIRSVGTVRRHSCSRRADLALRHASGTWHDHILVGVRRLHLPRGHEARLKAAAALPCRPMSRRLPSVTVAFQPWPLTVLLLLRRLVSHFGQPRFALSPALRMRSITAFRSRGIGPLRPASLPVLAPSLQVVRHLLANLVAGASRVGRAVSCRAPSGAALHNGPRASAAAHDPDLSSSLFARGRSPARPIRTARARWPAPSPRFPRTPRDAGVPIAQLRRSLVCERRAHGVPAIARNGNFSRSTRPGAP